MALQSYTRENARDETRACQAGAIAVAHWLKKGKNCVASLHLKPDGINQYPYIHYYMVNSTMKLGNH